MRRRHVLSWLCVALIVALALRIGLSLHSAIVHPDEVFQMEEPAHHLAFGYGVVSWEWRVGIRSWIFPYLFSLIMRAFSFAGGSAMYLIVIKTLLSVASLGAVLIAFHWVRRIAGDRAGLVAAFACAIWYQLAIYASHPLSEVLATDFLLPALYLQRFNDGKTWRLLLGCLLAGLAACARIQLLPIVVLAAALFYPFWQPRMIAYMAVALCTPLCISGLVDWMTWGHPFQSIWKYVLVNMTVSKRYGIEPWWWYLRDLALRLNVLLLAALLAVRRLPRMALLVAATVALFSVIPHKEERFLYPIWPLIIMMGAVGLYSCALTWRRLIMQPPRAYVPGLTIGVIGLVSFASVLSFHFWDGTADGIRLFDLLSRDASVCGVELLDVPWGNTGGYTHLHRDVPISIATNPLPTASIGSIGDNVVLAPADKKLVSSVYTLMTCSRGSRGICAYKRPGKCWPTSDLINAHLARMNQ
jgi:GPI mannosyltransferase 3